MLIVSEKNKIFIEEKGLKLKSYQYIQLRIWGFKRDYDNNRLYIESDNIDKNLFKLINYFNKEGSNFSLSLECEKYLETIKKTINEFNEIKELGKRFKDGDYDKEGFKGFCKFINDNLSRQLKVHQLKAAFHLYLIKNGANFSVPGSGKTTVVLSVFEVLRKEKRVNTLFIIGPPSCFGPWKDEFNFTIGREPKYCILAGGDWHQRKIEYFVNKENINELYLTTYQTLLKDQDEVIKFFGRKEIKPLLVVDEAHYIKQIGGLWSNVILRISKFAEYRCILTGTPLPKSYSDIFNLFDFLWPYNEPLDLNTKTQILFASQNHLENRAKEILNEKIGPLFYRVRKCDLGLLEPNFYPPILLEMNKYEKLIYEAIENKIKDYSKEDYFKNIDLILNLKKGRIIRLRQAVSYIKLLTTAIDSYSEKIIDDDESLSKIISKYDRLEKPAKLEYLITLISNFQKEKQKVIIWSYFIGTLKLISKFLINNNFRCKLIFGETPIEQTSIKKEETREDIRNEFIDPNSGLDILVANPAACGESVSLHKTCYRAIYYDLSYNCAQYLQSLDRIHRVGGSEKNQANYYFLHYKNTIDPDIKNNLDKKAKRMYDLIEKDYSIYSLDMFEDIDDEIEAYNRLFGDKNV